MNSLVYIIVLNWNGETLIRDCLNSLSKLNYKNYKIIVVDNNSTDESVKIIRDEFPLVGIVELEKNFGFAEGNNRGFESIQNKEVEYVIFLNNDTEVDAGFVEPLIKVLDSNNKIGQTASKIYYSNVRDTIWYAGGKVNRWTGQIRHIGIRKKDSLKFDMPYRTDYATGCCFAMRYNDFLEFGGFDSSYLMYCEDVDLSLRIRESGLFVQYVPESRIYHKISTSIGGEFSIKKFYMKLKGYIKLFFNHSNFFQKITIPIMWLLFSPFVIFKIIYLRFFSGD